MGRELEFKYTGTKAAFAALAQRFAPLEEVRMQTTYFDTPQGALSAKRWMLRQRLENGVSVFAMKLPLPDGSRAEWEAQAASLEEGLAALAALGAPRELPQGLIPTCGVRFTRRFARVALEGAQAELALDRGVLLGGNLRQKTLLEVEIEHKGGSEEAVRRFAEELAAEYELLEEPLSKFARARRLGL